MCVICASQSSENRPTEDQLATSIKNNKDGSGWAVLYTDTSGKRQIIQKKSLNGTELINQYFRALDELGDAVEGHLFHARIATHGKVCKELCHPFRMGRENAVIAHNGIFPLYMHKNDKRSDSKYFAEKSLPEMGGIKMLNTQTGFDVLNGFVEGSRSKVVVLSAEPNTQALMILGEDLGHWDKETQTWWSNSTYKSYSNIGSSHSSLANKRWNPVTKKYEDIDNEPYDHYGEDWDDWNGAIPIGKAHASNGPDDLDWESNRLEVAASTIVVPCKNPMCHEWLDRDAACCDDCYWCMECDLPWDQCSCPSSVFFDMPVAE